MNTNIISLKNSDLANLFQIFKDNNGNYVFNLNDTVNINIANTADNYYILHTVNKKESYQTISYMYYNTTRYWWIITKFNNISNVIDLPTQGTILKILNIDVVKFIIQQINNA